jgi:hypothetical protein
LQISHLRTHYRSQAAACYGLSHESMPLFNPLVAIRTRAAPTWDAGVLLGSFSAGTALLSHGPLAVIPLDEDKDSRCSRCLLRCEATVRTCGRCKCEVYCSDACQYPILFLSKFSQDRAEPFTRPRCGLERISFSHMSISALDILLSSSQSDFFCRYPRC